MRARSVRRRVAAALAGTAVVALAASGCSAMGRVTVDVPTQVEAALAVDTQKQLQDAVSFAMAATGASGAIVGVWAPWSGSWVAGLGTQSATDPTPVTSDMDFRIGDVTRAMTCDVLYETAAAGTVGLDDSVTDYVAGIPHLENVSLRELCDSSSGIGSYQGELQPLWLSNPERTWNPRELLAYGLGNTPEVLTPGVKFADSDAGYVLLGLALERATSRSAAELFEDRVFSPLGMTASALPAAAAAAPATADDALAGHTSLPGPDGAMNCAEPLDTTKISSSIGYTDSGVVSDVQDLRTYVQALATGALVPADQKRFGGTHPAYDNAPSWFTAGGGAYQAGSLVGQYGSVPGYLTAAFADPSSGLTVVVVLNNSGAGSGVGAALAWQLAAIASKAPAVNGQAAPEAGLPWTAQQFHDQIAAAAICALPAL